MSTTDPTNPADPAEVNLAYFQGDEAAGIPHGLIVLETGQRIANVMSYEVSTTYGHYWDETEVHMKLRGTFHHIGHGLPEEYLLAELRAKMGLVDEDDDEDEQDE